MSYTKHFNLPKLVSGAVDWVAAYNDAMDKLEAGRTFKFIAGETLTKGKCYKVVASGSAVVPDNVDNIPGIWQSASTAAGIEGFGQFDGFMTDSGWSWTVGVPLYSDSGVLTESIVGLRAVAYSLSASGIMILPMNI